MTGSSDFGWLRPKQTAILLINGGFLSYQEASQITNSGNLSLVEHGELEPHEIRWNRNREIIIALERKGFDGILYTNRQEPGDGVDRDAYLVFRSNQIFSAITFECLSSNV